MKREGGRREEKGREKGREKKREKDKATKHKRRRIV